MTALANLYGHSLALLTDLYQLTMAYGYWKNGLADRPATFHLFYRKNPFAGGYVLTCGLGEVIALLDQFRFEADDLVYLAELKGNDERPLFDDGFLRALEEMRFSCDVHAMPEGTVAFPHEPLVRVQGPLLQAQIIETALLTLFNFQSLIATKAARITQAAQGDAVLEFGLRRAQGIDGGISASRAAYVGGCVGTSNVLAGKLHGIPVKGTHAHSWVMTFDSELEAFEKYAAALPNNCVFLVDTYDTIEGVKNAIHVGQHLRERGHEMVGIRLDSGDLAYLSIAARELLDAAGFSDAAIVASNDLDEHLIASLKEQGATIAVWGVGTKLATAYDQPALGGVYKLSAIHNEAGEWEPRIKLSEQAIKVSNPGRLQVRRFLQDGQAVADMIYDDDLQVDEQCLMVDPMDSTRRRSLGTITESHDLLVPIFQQGERVYDSPPLKEIRDYAQMQLAMYHPGVKRRLNAHEYPVGLEHQLYELKTKLILAAREQTHRDA